MSGTGGRSLRSRRMEEKLLAAAGEAGLEPPDLELLGRAHKLAMEPRERGLPSDHDPAFLHPARTVLILLGDMEERGVGVLVVGALAESRSPELRVPPERAEALLREAGPEAWGWWRALPEPGWRDAEAETADLIELLLSVSEPVRRVALAEALDHLRHAHRWEDPADRARAARLARRVFGPLAARVHPTLERRLSWWNERVGSTLEGERAG